jgi:hypothetical protein
MGFEIKTLRVMKTLRVWLQGGKKCAGCPPLEGDDRGRKKNILK